jgi:hypothetical protein
VRFEGPEVVERFDPSTLPEAPPRPTAAQQSLFDTPPAKAARSRKR